MRKKYLSRILLGGLIIASTVTLNSCKDYDDDIDGLQEQIDSLSSLHDSEVSTLESSISTLQTTASSLSSEIADVQEELEAAIAEKADESEVEALESEVASLTASLSQVETAISTLEAAHDADIAALETALAEANANITAAQTTANEALAAATTANETLTTLIESLATLQADITTQLATLESDVKDALQNAANAQADATAALTYIETLQELEAEDSSKIAELEAAQTTLEENLTDLDTRVTAAETAITELWAAVNAGVSDADLETIQSLINSASADLQTQIDEINDGLTTITTDIETIKESILTLYGVVVNQLKSLVFIPQVYVDGVEGLQYGSYTYSPLDVVTYEGYQAEEWSTAEGTEDVTIVPTVYAQYYVNPSTALSSVLKLSVSDLEIVYPNNSSSTTYISSRTKASDDFGIEIVSFEEDPDVEGAIRVYLNITGDAATVEYITTFALQINSATDDSEDEEDAEEEDNIVTSDFATLYQFAYDDIVIAKTIDGELTTDTDYHYRTQMADDETGAGIEDCIWNYSDDIEETQENCDLSVAYDSSIDLAEYVTSHILNEDGDCELEYADLELLGLTYEFSVVQYYIVGDNQTNQKDFVELEGSVFTPAVYDSGTGTASINRTPIIRVKIMDGDNVVKVAYIKVYIAEAETKTDAIEIIIEGDALVYSCDDAVVYTTTEQMNKLVYNATGYSKSDFHTLYTTLVDVEAEDGLDVGEAVEYAPDDAQTTATYWIQWTITSDDLWANAGKTIKNEVQYQKANGEYITIILYHEVEALPTKFTPTYINEYWTSNYGYAELNVNVPNVGETDDDLCIFVNDLNGLFVTDSSTGIITLESYNNLDVTVEYYFCEADVAKITKIGDYTVAFTVENETELYATYNGTTELIATIYNDNSQENAYQTKTYANAIVLNEESDIAMLLLNTNELYTYIGATAYFCEDADKAVTLDFNGSDHFQINYIRPIYVNDESEGYFQDGRSLGEEGTYISYEQLVGLYDWRNYSFEETVDGSSYKYLYDYYGIEEITVDTENAQCDLNGTMQAITYNMELEAYDGTGTIDTVLGLSTGDTTETGYGWLTYVNNNANVQTDYNIYVTVTVTYKWGTVESTTIAIPVNNTKKLTE